MSKDGHLVVRHENEIGGTTDVADHAAFAGRRTTKTIDGVATVGWFTEDFTLAELKSLRARERLPELRPGNLALTDEAILTFQEVIDIARTGSARTGRIIGVAPELKHPTYFAGLGLEMTSPLIDALRGNGLAETDSAILIQCFETATLRTLKRRIRSPLLQLLALRGGPADRPGDLYADMAKPAGLVEIASYADFIGVETTLIIPVAETGLASAPAPLIHDAHAAGLKVVAWTFRAEDAFLPADHRGDLSGWLQRFYDLGVDAVFSDFPAIAVTARDAQRPATS